MKKTIDIKEVSKYKVASPVWYELMCFLEKEDRCPDGLEFEVQSYFSQGSNSGFTKSYLAWLGVHFKLHSVISLLVKELGENWLPFGKNRERYCYSPDQALLRFGEVALPALEKRLAETDQIELIRLIAIMLFNIHRSKEAARLKLEEFLPSREPEVKPHFDTVLEEMKAWKG